MAWQVKYIIHPLIWIGVVAILSTVIVSSHSIQISEMAYQKWWLSRAVIVFVVCTLLSFSADKKGNVFYLSVVWSLILLGGMEAIWGIRQIYGLSSSNHSLYSLTGSFYNPGPYSGYLAMVFPVCLSEWLNLRKNKQRSWLEHGKYYVSLGVLLLILCVLPAGLSRSAWMAAIIAGVFVYGMHQSWKSRLKKWGMLHRKKMIAVIAVGGVALIMVGCALFYLKADSARGRLLMWKISTMAIAENPWLGHGHDNFIQAYGTAQENYFAGKDYTANEEYVAGSPEYAFNEYLQVAVEHGVLFLVVVLLIIGFCLWKGVTEQRIGVCGGVISVLVFAFSSYPMQIPGFAIAFYCLLAACVVGRSRMPILLFTVIIALLGTYYWKHNQYDACKKWYGAKMLYNVGAFQVAKEDYEKLYPELNDRGTFLFEYGHSLHKLKEYKCSAEILEEALKVSNNSMILNVIGKNYQELGEYAKAEEWLIRSTHRLPGRIYPYYLLAKLYADPGFNQPEKLKHVVEVVLTKEPKVQSTAVKEMREEVKKLIDKR